MVAGNMALPTEMCVLINQGIIIDIELFVILERKQFSVSPCDGVNAKLKPVVFIYLPLVLQQSTISAILPLFFVRCRLSLSGSRATLSENQPIPA